MNIARRVALTAISLLSLLASSSACADEHWNYIIRKSGTTDTFPEVRITSTENGSPTLTYFRPDPHFTYLIGKLRFTESGRICIFSGEEDGVTTHLFDKPLEKLIPGEQTHGVSVSFSLDGAPKVTTFIVTASQSVYGTELHWAMSDNRLTIYALLDKNGDSNLFTPKASLYIYRNDDGSINSRYEHERFEGTKPRLTPHPWFATFRGDS